jgi:hypothetical protein
VALAPWFPAFAVMTINLLIFRHSFVVGLLAKSLTQKWGVNAKVGKSDYERAYAGKRGNDEEQRNRSFGRLPKEKLWFTY